MPIFTVEAMDILKINDLELNDGTSYAVMDDGFVPRPATVRQQFSDSPFTAGQKYRKRLSKPENQELSFRVKVLGTSKDDMDAKLHAIYDEIVKDESEITWKPDQREDYSYWTAFGSPSGEVDTYFDFDFQTAEICILSWVMMALPGPLGDWEELAPVWCQGDDNSFEEDDGVDLQFWDIETFVGGAWAKESGAGNFLHGVQSLSLTGAAAGELIVATEKTLIQVNELEHFDYHAFAKKLSGTGDVDYQLKCYEADGTLVGDNDSNLLADEDCSWEGGSVGNYALLTNGTIANSGAEFYQGIRSLELTVTANGTAQTGNTVTAFTVAGSEYTFVAKLKSASGRQYRVRLWDDVGGYVDGGLVTADGTQQTATVTGTYNAASIDRRVYLYAHIDALAADIVYWDSAILAAGATAAPPTDLGILDVLIGDDPTNAFLDRVTLFSSSNGVIHPSTSGETVKFPTGTTQIKRRIQQFGIGSVAFDDLYFANSEYAPDYKIRPTMGLVVPGTDIKGNLPADADLYFSHPYAQLCWAAQTIPNAGQSLYDIAVVDATHVWTISYDNSKVYFWNGSSWVVQATLGGTHLRGIFALDANNVWACGYEKVWYYNGAVWDAGTTVKATIYWADLWGSAANSVWVVGAGGEIYFWNGAAWAAQASGTTSSLFTIDGSAANNVWVGAYDRILQWDGANWSSHTPLGADLVYGIAAIDATHIWASSWTTNKVFFYNGAGWFLKHIAKEPLRQIFAQAINQIWICGANGFMLYYDGTTWEQQCSATTEILYAVDGFDADNVWTVGVDSTIRVNWLTAEAVPFTDIWIGQRNDYHADYNPVVQPIDGAVAYLYTRMDSDYRTLAAAATATARFLLAAHEGSHLLTIGITFSAATAVDKCNIKLLLQTPAGTDITGDVVEFEIDMGDPTAVWKEVAMLTTRFDPIDLPSHYARADAGAIYQVVRLTADAALAAVELWLDHIALIPTDRYVEVKDFDKNSLILSSHEKRAVLSSLNGTLSQAQSVDASTKIGTPRFVMSSKGLNMAVCQIYNDYGVSGDHQVGQHSIPANIVIRWRPRRYLTPS